MLMKVLLKYRFLMVLDMVPGNLPQLNHDFMTWGSFLNCWKFVGVISGHRWILLIMGHICKALVLGKQSRCRGLETPQLYMNTCVIYKMTIHYIVLHSFLPLSPPGWRGIVVTVRAGGLAVGRSGGRLPDLRNPYLCNRLMDFLRSKFYGIV